MLTCTHTCTHTRTRTQQPSTWCHEAALGKQQWHALLLYVQGCKQACHATRSVSLTAWGFKFVCSMWTHGWLSWLEWSAILSLFVAKDPLAQPQALKTNSDGRRNAVQQSGHAPSALRADMMESISSMKMTLGCITPATANRVFTCIFTGQHHKQQQQVHNHQQALAWIVHSSDTWVQWLWGAMGSCQQWQRCARKLGAQHNGHLPSSRPLQSICWSGCWR